MKLNLLSFLDIFLPSSLLQQGDQSKLLRGRVLVSLSLMYLSSLASLALVLTVLGLLDILVLWSGVISSLVSCAFYTFQLLYFKRTGNLFRAANIGMFTMVTATTVFIVLTGGWTSPVMMIFMCTSMCAFLMEGKYSGIFWSFLIGVAYLVFFLIHRQGMVLPQVVDPSLHELLAYASWLYGWMIILGGMALYAGLTRRLNDSANQEREQLRIKATYDPLTGVYYRPSFHQLLPGLLARCHHNNNGFLFVDIEIRAKHSLPRGQREGLLIQVAQTLEGCFPEGLLLARSSGLSFQALIQKVNNVDVATSIMTSLHAAVAAALDHAVLEVILGGVMAPGYTDDQEIMIATARKAVQEARNRRQPFVLYTEANRISAHRWTADNWLCGRYAELAGSAAKA